MSPTTLNARVRARRNDLGLTLSQVAEMSGLSVSYISAIEQGRGNPTVTALQALAGALGWSVADFFAEDSGNDQPNAADRHAVEGREGSPLVQRAERSAARSPHEPVYGVPGSDVGEWMRIDRSDLLEWASSEGASLRLPELIRRLVEETTPAGTHVDFPAGTGVLSGGWDGLVLCEGDHPFVPSGRSGWEVSTEKNSNRKAQQDYENRCGKVPREARAGMVYVAVICRAWIGARDFAETKSVAGDFREVRACNVDHLETWLARAPETTLWLREVIGKPVGVEPLSRFWDRWLESATVPLDAGVVLAGRDTAAQQLLRLCLAGGVVTVGWDAPHEEILVFISAAFADSDAGREALYVEDPDSARRLLAPPTRRRRPSALTVVVPSLALAERLAPRAPQCVVVPVPGSGAVSVRVGPVDSVKTAERLRTLGIEHDRAWELGHLGRRSLLALRRRLALQPELYQPGWSGDNDATLRRCLLLNRWDRSSEGDVQAVQRFVGKSYLEIEERLERVTRFEGGDPPLMRTGSVWHVVSPEDAWVVAGHGLRDEDLTDMANLAAEVLGGPDPLQGLDGVERLYAQLRGERPLHSQRLKEGLAASLAVLATAGTHVPAQASHIVHGAVTKLLNAANTDPTLQRWTPVAPWLPLLAEAAPDAVLEAVRTGLSGDEPPLTATFSDQELDEYGFPRDLPKRHFLAALDVLSWSPRYLTPAVDLLATLDELDPRSGLSHRPASVLKDIMCPWMPNTSASNDQRLAALEAMRDRHPQVAWEVMMSMLPSAHSGKTDGFTPRYRDWKDHRQPVTRGDHYDTVARVSTLLIADAAAQPRRYSELILRCGDMPPWMRANLLHDLRRVARGTDEAARRAIWPALRMTVARHREFSDTDWALPPDEIAEFESLLEPLRPGSCSESHGWLFDHSVPLLEGVPRRHIDREEYKAALAERRTAAVAEILDAGGIESALEFAGSVRAPSLVGTVLASLAPQGADAVMLTRLAVGEPPSTDAARGYFVERFRAGGWDLFDALVAESDVSAAAVAELLRASLDPRAAWERLEGLEPEVGREYWCRITEMDLWRNDDLVVQAARRMAAAGRADSSASLLAGSSYRLEADPEFAEASAEMLEQRLEQEDEPDTVLTDDCLTSLLGVLNRHSGALGEQRVARIEWAYLPALGWGTETPCLHKILAEDPDFFAEIVQLAHIDERVDKEGEDVEADHRDPRRSSVAYGLLREWPQSPGLNDDSNLDPDGLHEWVTRARARLAEVGRTRSGDMAIGSALAASPTDPGGEWPVPAVCNMIEEIGSDEIDRGFSTAVFNSRGVVSGSIWEGGEQERELADRYHKISYELENDWHRTAAIFSRLASHYEKSALTLDAEAEARQRGIAL